MYQSSLGKKAATIPLSPEEQQEASELVGKSLFSALQLIKEQQRTKQKLMADEENDSKVLKIPIPKRLMPLKSAEENSLAPYSEDMHGIRENPGLIPHIRRNIGKYIGSYAGAMLGGGLGARRAYKQSPNPGATKLLKRILQRGTTGTISGALLGGMYDEAANENIMQQMAQNSQQAQGVKYANELDDAEPGIMGRAFKSQQNPLKLLLGAQSGFKGAKKDYYMEQKALINKELDQAQREYIDLLEKIKTGSEHTPHVDAFCNGIAYAALFDKQASSEEDVDISDDSIKRMMESVLGYAKKPFKPAIDTAASGLLGTALGATYLTAALRKNMREEPDKYMQEHMPTRVELRPYE